MKILSWEELHKLNFHHQFYQFLAEKFSPHISPERTASWIKNLPIPLATQFLRIVHSSTPKEDLVGMFQKSNFELKSTYLSLLQKAKVNTHLKECLEIPIEYTILENEDYKRQFEEKKKELLSKHRVVVVDVGCGNAVLSGSHVFVPGIWAVPNRISKEEEVLVVADVQHACIRLEKFSKMEEFHHDASFVVVGIGKLKKEANELHHGKGIGIEMHMPLFHSLPLSETTKEGLFFEQHYSSMITAHLLIDDECKQNANQMTILDACAAPGGKTTYMAQLLQNRGHILATDRSAKRLEKLKQNVTLQKWTNIEAKTLDMSKSVKVLGKEKFDRILCDIMCSASGIRPMLSNQDAKIHEIQHCTSVQKGILHQVVQLLKPNGILSLSTCSVTPQENELNVKYILERDSSLELMDLPEPFRPENGFSYATHGLGMMEPHLVNKVLRFDSSIHPSSINFFTCRFRKKQIFY